MNAKEIIDAARNADKITQKELADALGMCSQQAVGNMLTRKNGMRVDNFVKMMEVMGYDVVVRNRVTDEEIEIVGGLD